MPGQKSVKKRLDQSMVDMGLSDTIQKARALVMAARVIVNGNLVTTSGHMVALDEKIALDAEPEYYGRGGIKLAYALEHFGIVVKRVKALDVGASKGGFTHCLLKKGASRIYALDVGYGQLDYRLRLDSRVVVMERVNARYPFSLEDMVHVVTVDVSFISITKVLLSAASHLGFGGVIVALVKPQFEARRNEVGSGGVIRDPMVHARVLGRVINWAVNNGLRLRGLVLSPITGDAGNREFFLLLSPVAD